MKKWKDKIAFTRKQFLGSKRSRTKVMKSMRRMDRENVLNLYKERKEIFNTVKKYRVGKGKVTNEGLKMALAELKYDNTNSLDKKEIKTLAKEFNIKGKLDRKVLRKSKAFLEKKKNKLAKKYEKTHKLSKEMKFFFPYVNLGEITNTSKVKPIVRNEYINNGSSFRQKLENYKLRINREKKQPKSVNIFHKNLEKNESDKLRKNTEGQSEKSIFEDFSIKTVKEKKEFNEIKKKEKTKNEKKFNVAYKDVIKKEKEQYKNRYRVDLKKKKDEYKQRYRIKAKKEALEKISKFVNKDISKDSDNKQDEKKHIDRIDKYKQKYLDIKEQSKNRYKVDVDKNREEYKQRYRIKKKEEAIRKRYEREHKHELEKNKIFTEKEDVNKNDEKEKLHKSNNETKQELEEQKDKKIKSSNVEVNIIKASGFRGKGEREVAISEEAIKNSLEDQKKSKERMEFEKREKILKKIQSLTKQIINKSAPVREYDKIKEINTLFYIDMEDFKNKKEQGNMHLDNKIQ